MLMALGSHYWAPDFSPAQAEQRLADYLEDLSEFPLAETEIAIREWRRDPSKTLFPKPSQLRGIILANRAARASRDDAPKGRAVPEFGDGRPIRWWTIPRNFWKPHWRETEVPRGEKVRDCLGAPLRDPERVVF